MIPLSPSPLVLVADHPGQSAGIALYLKRDDLLHPTVAGSKWRKLEPIVLLIQEQQYAGILTYGGPFSNHLQAVAAAGKAYGFPTVGVVRGVAANLSNPTLSFAQECGMQLIAVTKQEYDLGENSPRLRAIAARFADYFQLPEGGATRLAVDNCRRITWEIQRQLPADRYQSLVVCVPAGTGCTAAGVIAGLGDAGATWIFPAVNYGVDEATIQDYLSDCPSSASPDFLFIRDYTFGGFAVHHKALMAFTRTFRDQTGILLDPIYTSKMMFGVFDLLLKGQFAPGSIVVALHTGGLQGWDGFRQRFGEMEIFK